MGRAQGSRQTSSARPRPRPRSRSASVVVNEWPDEDDIAFAVGLALQEAEPLPGIEMLMRRIAKHCGLPLLGTKRAVFSVNERWVLKVPLTWEGDAANEREAKHSDSFIPLARCRAHHSLPSGVILLWMERVQPIVVPTPHPLWVDSVDCGQVGYTADGCLVAYDL